MVYTKSTWAEHSMTQAQKLTALTNLETIYDEGCSYIDSITHSSRYYNETECGTKYITAANDGSGSGVICEKLDGYTAQQIIDAGIPSGTIAFWKGSEATIPSGWYLCNGSNGTPDLRNRFIIAVGTNHAYGSTGGASHKTLSSKTFAVGTHEITGDELPSHNHSYDDAYYTSMSGASGISTSYGESSDHTSSTNSATSTAHGHTGSYFTGGDTDFRPKFYALCMIMKG